MYIGKVNWQTEINPKSLRGKELRHAGRAPGDVKPYAINTYDPTSFHWRVVCRGESQPPGG